MHEARVVLRAGAEVGWPAIVRLSVSPSQASCCFRMFCPRREAAAGVLKPCFGVRHCGLSGLLVSAGTKTFSEFCLE
jgi:hypothetical protein